MTELSPAEASAIVGDDIEHWLANPFMTPALLAKKAAFWVAAARAEGARGMRTKIEALADEWQHQTCEGYYNPDNCETCRCIRDLRALLADGGESQ